MTLVILAAGMGSRYGGLKQLDPMTKHGEFIIDFSIYDAHLSGVDRVVFLIKKEHENLFKETIGNRIADHIAVEYAYQSLEQLPIEFNVPRDRTKPWGTVQAVLCTKEVVGDDNFIVINADDFYGREAYTIIANALSSTEHDSVEFCMAGYLMKNTLSDNGSVSRGVCVVDSNNQLLGMDERKNIYRRSDSQIVYEESNNQYPIDDNCFASMNFWGFTPEVFRILEEEFIAFMHSEQTDLNKDELCLSTAIDSAMKQNKCKVAVLPTKAKWYGITYQQDKEYVVSSIKKLVDDRTYPDGLFK